MAPASLAFCKSINCCPTVGALVVVLVPPPRDRPPMQPVRSVKAAKPTNTGASNFFMRFYFCVLNCIQLPPDADIGYFLFGLPLAGELLPGLPCGPLLPPDGPVGVGGRNTLLTELF